VKVVILGQDPYHEPGQAHGLAFSVQPGVPKPPSLINIFQELRDDLGIPEPQNGTLTKWAEQGVLLLNTALTVREHQANSHHGKGWEILTDRIIELLGQRSEPMVFMLWGNNARSKRDLIDRSRHLVLEAPHPSPLSAHRGFFGGRYFSRANAFLKEPVDWRL
jgi:uracil-DNA glycosylase